MKKYVIKLLSQAGASQAALSQATSSHAALSQAALNESLCSEANQCQGAMNLVALMQAVSNKATSSQPALKKYTNANETDIMEEDTADEPIVDASSQYRTLDNAVPPVEVINIDGTNQDDDE
eukprot:5731628-Ditylum_brightwellii.AAC.1